MQVEKKSPNPRELSEDSRKILEFALSLSKKKKEETGQTAPNVSGKRNV